MEVDLIVFDMTGTTVQDGDAVNRALRESLLGAGVRASEDESRDVMGLPTPEGIAMLLARFRGQAAATPAAVEAVHAEFVRRMLWHYQSHPDVQECDGASDLFAWCQRNGILTALDTGFSREIAEAVIARLGWRTRGLLDATVASDEVDRGRPHPDMIHRLMDRTGIADPARVVKIGDTPVDIAQGHAANCRYVIGITTGAYTASELKVHGPTHLVDELLELPDLLSRPREGAA